MEFTYSTQNPDCPVAYASLRAMHTECEFLLPRCPEKEAREWCGEAEALIEEADQRYNRFSSDSLLYQVNAQAPSHPVKADEELFLVLELCETFRKATRGWFCAGTPLLDAREKTVSLRGDSLDLGGFIKGFVLDKILKQTGLPCDNALLSLGGSSSYAKGHHPFSDTWGVSIPQRLFPGKTAHTFQLKDCALSVSGKDRRGRCHILNPWTGKAEDRGGPVAVTGPSPLVCEVLSTALWIAPENERKLILDAFEGYQSIQLSADA